MTATTSWSGKRQRCSNVSAQHARAAGGSSGTQPPLPCCRDREQRVELRAATACAGPGASALCAGAAQWAPPLPAPPPPRAARAQQPPPPLAPATGMARDAAERDTLRGVAGGLVSERDALARRLQQLRADLEEDTAAAHAAEQGAHVAAGADERWGAGARRERRASCSGGYGGGGRAVHHPSPLCPCPNPMKPCAAPPPSPATPPDLQQERAAVASRLGALDKVLALYRNTLGLELVPGDGAAAGAPRRGASRRELACPRPAACATPCPGCPGPLPARQTASPAPVCPTPPPHSPIHARTHTHACAPQTTWPWCSR